MVFVSGAFDNDLKNKNVAIECAKYLQRHYFKDEQVVSGIFSFVGDYDEITLDQCKDLLRRCDKVVFLSNYLNSKGAKEEECFVNTECPWIEKYFFDYCNRCLYKFHKDGNLELVKEDKIYN